MMLPGLEILGGGMPKGFFVARLEPLLTLAGIPHVVKKVEGVSLEPNIVVLHILPFP